MDFIVAPRMARKDAFPRGPSLHPPAKFSVRIRSLLSRLRESLGFAGLCIPSALPGHLNAKSFSY